MPNQTRYFCPMTTIFICLGEALRSLPPCIPLLIVAIVTRPLGVVMNPGMKANRGQETKRLDSPGQTGTIDLV